MDWTDAFHAAETLNFPPLLTDVPGSSPSNASPYVTTLDALCHSALGRVRSTEFAHLRTYLQQLARAGLGVDFILLGGSVLDARRSPRDLDCLMLYRLNGRPFDTSGLPDLQAASREFGIDARLAPIDSDLLPTLKITIFMSLLFSIDRSKALARGLVLVDCRPPRGLPNI